MSQQHHSHHHPNDGYGRDVTNSSSYEVWNNFFLSAGIPSAVANDYAVTFSQHRIRIDMLKEITKDILLDMGIKAMGDIIAILRHAKNLYQQDELKSGRAKATTAPTMDLTNATQIADPPVPKHISQRTPITISSRPGSNISSLVGNKIQSRLNLNSGALVASSSNHSSLSSQINQKRPSSTISSSLAKRLRPAPNESGRELNRELSEKTLTVHYPSSSAIARAQQRISGTRVTTTNQLNISSSIKSRLGSSTSDSGRSRSELSSNHNNNTAKNDNYSRNSNHKHGGNPTRTYNANNIISLSSNKSRSYSKDSDARRQQSRPRSTVFSRLGEAAR